MRSRNPSAQFQTRVPAAFGADDESGPSTRKVARRQCSRWGKVIIAATLVLSPGCQLNRSFFQMDSDSRVPFFGIDLAPDWGKRDSAVDGVSRLQSEPREQASSAATVGAEPESPRSLTLPLSESVVTTTAAEGAPAETFR